MTKTNVQVQALANAMWQLLDDMGRDGLSVCGQAKAQARVAFEPWMNGYIEEPEDLAMYDKAWMSLADAKRLLAEIDEAYANLKPASSDRARMFWKAVT